MALGVDFTVIPKKIPSFGDLPEGALILLAFPDKAVPEERVGSLEVTELAHDPTATGGPSHVATLTDVGDTFEDLVTGATASSFFVITMEVSVDYLPTPILESVFIRFQDLSTDERIVPIAGAFSDEAIHLRRFETGGRIQVKRSEHISATNKVIAYRVQ